MARKIPVVLSITGESEREATLFSELMASLLKPKHGSHIVSRIAMEAILTRWGMNQSSILGEKLRKANDAMSECGIPIPNELLMEAFQAWTAELDHLNLQVLLLTGAPKCVQEMLPRTCGQLMTIKVDFDTDHPEKALKKTLSDMHDHGHPLAMTGLNRLKEPGHQIHTFIREIVDQISPAVAA